MSNDVSHGSRVNYVIPEPCHENWDEMTAQDQGRYCAVCDKVVVDMTAMDADEMTQILEMSRAQSSDPCQTGVCAQVHTDKQGKIIPARKHRLLTDAMAAMLAVSLWGCSDTEVGDKPAMNNLPVEVPTTVPINDSVLIDPHVEPIEVMGEIELLPEAKPVEAHVKMGKFVPAPQAVIRGAIKALPVQEDCEITEQAVAEPVGEKRIILGEIIEILPPQQALPPQRTL